MKTTLTVILIIVAIVLIGSILLMSPKKWGIWIGIGGSASMGGSNEYGSKKTIERKLQIIATVCAIIFVGICIVLPFVK